MRLCMQATAFNQQAFGHQTRLSYRFGEELDSSAATFKTDIPIPEAYSPSSVAAETQMLANTKAPLFTRRSMLWMLPVVGMLFGVGTYLHRAPAGNASFFPMQPLPEALNPVASLSLPGQWLSQLQKNKQSLPQKIALFHRLSTLPAHQLEPALPEVLALFNMAIEQGKYCPPPLSFSQARQRNNISQGFWQWCKQQPMRKQPTLSDNYLIGRVQKCYQKLLYRDDLSLAFRNQLRSPMDAPLLAQHLKEWPAWQRPYSWSHLLE